MTSPYKNPLPRKEKPYTTTTLNLYYCSPGALIFALLIFLPIREHVRNARTAGQPIHLLKILFGNLKRLGCHVRDVLANQFARVNARLINLFKDKAPERLNARPEKGAVERNINAFERNGGKAALKLNGFGLCFGLPGTLLNDFDKMGFDFFNRHRFHE